MIVITLQNLLTHIILIAMIDKVQRTTICKRNASKRISRKARKFGQLRKFTFFTEIKFVLVVFKN
jgi:hypothetical protein